MDITAHNEHSGIFLAVFVAIPQDFGRKHFKTVCPCVINLGLYGVFVNDDLNSHHFTPLHKGHFPMVKVVCIVPQFINAYNGIHLTPNNNAHIPKV